MAHGRRHRAQVSGFPQSRRDRSPQDRYDEVYRCYRQLQRGLLPTCRVLKRVRGEPATMVASPDAGGYPRP